MSLNGTDAPISVEEIRRTLVDRPPVAIGDEPSIREGVDSDLDEWRSLRDGGKDAIARIQTEERARTGINSLKVGYNRVFGYFIEVTNSNSHLVPADYQRRQTLTGAERYVTPALKEYEEKCSHRRGADRRTRARAVRGAPQRSRSADSPPAVRSPRSSQSSMCSRRSPK